MESLVTITPKFQIHLPVEIRKVAGIKTHGKVSIKAQKGKITITPIKDRVGMLAGKYKVKKPLPVDKIRDYIDYSKW